MAPNDSARQLLPARRRILFCLLLFRQLEINRLTQNVEEQFLALLNARRGRARRQQVKRGHPFGKTAVASQETNALHPLPVGLLQRAQHVA